MEQEYKERMKLIVLLAVIFTATIIVMFVAYGIYHFRVNATGDTSGTLVPQIKENIHGASIEYLGDISIEQSKMMYVAGTSILTSKITNNGTTKDNICFIVKVLNDDGSAVAEVMGFVGTIKSKETKYIDSYISKNVLNAKDIKYKLMQQ